MNRIGISTAMLVLSTPFVSWGAECNGGGTPFGKYQTVTKGMLDLTMAGKMNHATSNDIGEQVKIAEALAEKGEQQKSCDVYDAVIAKYGFKTMEESYYEKYPEKRPGSSARNQVKNQSSGASATSAVAGEAATDDGATASEAE
ncbi:MAG: hypothetical protein B6D77_07405 [gamma proteobacterium symbiont of Ctena orbiculata]|nr:MAG: hypothetical protein B6D77_07405 [gamma proteobacterium symbiont of Ctena orbiculata]PVV18685.1 MAG: hypothetical protein B6D78_15610 [gamma proteobacterium symbiont of Ctena orbiculata]